IMRVGVLRGIPWLIIAAAMLCDSVVGRHRHAAIASCGGWRTRQCCTAILPFRMGNAPMPIELWTWNTPNGRKISVALEEMGLPYTVKPVNISKGEQFGEAVLKISPNNKIPAIIDEDGPGGK